MKYRNLHNPAERSARRWRWIRGTAILAALAFALSIASFQARSAGIRREVLRLHVIANSNSEIDQRAKYHVRDAMLAEGSRLFDGTVNAAQAEAVITPRTNTLENTARRALEELGLDHPVHVAVGSAFFGTRSYAAAGLTFPAGRYQAVQVFLGESGGENWWCVMFPPLCLPAARPAGIDAVLTDGQLRLVESNPRYEVRFRVVELWEELMERFR